MMLKLLLYTYCSVFGNLCHYLYTLAWKKSINAQLHDVIREMRLYNLRETWFQCLFLAYLTFSLHYKFPLSILLCKTFCSLPKLPGFHVHSQEYNLGYHVIKSIFAWQNHVNISLKVEHFCHEVAVQVLWKKSINSKSYLKNNMVRSLFGSVYLESATTLLVTMNSPLGNFWWGNKHSDTCKDKMFVFNIYIERSQA